MSEALTIVTGAAGALGSEIAAQLLASGERVAAVDRSETADVLRKVAHAYPGRYLDLTFDVASPADWGVAIARIERELGAPTGAVFTAGGWRGGAPFYAAAADAIWDAMLATNLDTARQSLRAVLPGMVARRRG